MVFSLLFLKYSTLRIIWGEVVFLGHLYIDTEIIGNTKLKVELNVQKRSRSACDSLFTLW